VISWLLSTFLQQHSLVLLLIYARHVLHKVVSSTARRPAALLCWHIVMRTECVGGSFGRWVQDPRDIFLNSVTPVRNKMVIGHA
jgi:hypothetical protein